MRRNISPFLFEYSGIDSNGFGDETTPKILHRETSDIQPVDSNQDIRNRTQILYEREINQEHPDVLNNRANNYSKF